ncbi:hypothetical protein [Maribellus sediminis]|uniref:DUF1281 family ferredoxin-like fold protein n=1 Tax=Maribellus sediminis TaxID=2696285 RepID=UPI0014302ED3|nr:hypothetical protein [Maribellus sediminis]
MSTFYSNTLKIVGSDKQVSEVRKFIAGTGDTEFIDFNNIDPMPKELKLETISGHESMAIQLLWGQNSSYRNESIEKIQLLFSGLGTQEQQRAIDIAFEYKNYKEEYGSGTQMEWIRQSWGTIWSESYSQRLLNKDEIQFETKNASGKVIVDKLSQRFPDTELRLQYWNEQDYSGEYVFKNGLIKETEVWEMHP